MRGANLKPSRWHRPKTWSVKPAVSVYAPRSEDRTRGKEPVEHVRGVPHDGVDDLGMEGGVLVRDVGIKGDAGVVAVFKVHLTGGFAAGRAEALAVG